MNRDRKNVIILGLFILYIVLYKLCILPLTSKYSLYVTASFLLISFILSSKLLGFRHNKNTYLSQNLFKIVLKDTIIFFIVIYGLGLMVGFSKNLYFTDIFTVFRNLFIYIIIYVLIEFIRYIVIWANKDKKIIMYLYIIVLCILDICIHVRVSEYTFMGILFVFMMNVVPIIIKNILLSYLCYYTGYRVSLLYRLLLDCYCFVVPVIPNIGEVMNCLVLINFPFIIYYSAYKVIDQRENKYKPIFYKYNFKVFKIIFVSCFIIIGCLISGLFPYYVVGILSNSMSPNINKGDAVLVWNGNNHTKIKVNDIIAFKENDSIIVHRVIGIKNGKYITKGDANNVEDENLVSRSQIKGIVKSSIPVVAYPSVFFSEMLK